MLCLFWVRTLAGWCIVWAETGYFFQSATLYALFSESKKPPARIKGKRFSRLRRRRESVATGGFHSKECKCPELGFLPLKRFF